MTTLESAGLTSATFQQHVADDAAEELQRLELIREQAEAHLDAVLASIRTVKAVLKAAQNGGGKKPGPQKPNRKQSPFSMSTERMGQMQDWLDSLDGSTEITSRAMAEQFPGWSDSYCNMSLKLFRELGHIRLAATAGSAHIYRKMG